MKRMILILVIGLFSLTAKASGGEKYSLPLVYNMADYSYTEYIYAICKDLKIEGNIYLVKTTLPIHGYVEKQKFGWVIYVSRNDSYYGITIAHEMVHIWQCENGRLDMSKPDYSIKKQQYINSGYATLEQEARDYGRKLYYQNKHFINY